MARQETSWSEEHSRVFSGHHETVRGYVRYEVTRQNLLDSIGEFLRSPRRVADIGGGTGLDARWLSRVGAGHNVTLIEPDDRSVEEALLSTDGTVNVLKGDSRTALQQFGPASFDLILSHGVLQYFDEPHQELGRLADLLRPGGYISLLNAGLLGKFDRLQSHGEEAEAGRLRLSGKFINDVGIDSNAFLPEELESLIESAGLEVVDWFGVRLYSDDDYRSAEAVPVFHRNRIIGQELRASRDPSLRANGQMLHFIARKSTS